MIGFVHRHLRKHVDEPQIVRAIEAAEAKTTGRIHVTLAPHFWGGVRAAAHRAFAKLGLANSPDRNGVLIFVVPSRRRFAIVGDTAIHDKVGQEFWERVTAAMTEKIRSGDLTRGLVHAVHEAGRELAAHFPRKNHDRS
jgi:uncharacterized membrane protein